MTEEAQSQAQEGGNQKQVDPAFLTCVNEYLEMTDSQARQHGHLRVSMAVLYAAARFNAHAYLVKVGPKAAEDRAGFLDYMGSLYRRMLNEHLDAFGAERGIDVGVSELAEAYVAAGYTPTGELVALADDDKGE